MRNPLKPTKRVPQGRGSGLDAPLGSPKGRSPRARSRVRPQKVPDIPVLGLDPGVAAMSARFAPPLPVCDFAEKLLYVTPELWQRVILKLFAGEALDTEPREPYDISEAEWLELAHQRGRTPPDLYERLRARGYPESGKGFSNIHLVVGRRSGKTQCIAIATLYRAYLLLRHPNPQSLYGMQEGETIFIAVAANSEDQSTEAPFGRIKSILQEVDARGGLLGSYLDYDGIKAQSIYFKTLRDRRVAGMGGTATGNSRVASIRIRAYHTNQRTVRGGAVILTLFDEFGWFPVTEVEDKGETFYGTLTKGQQQFGEDAASFTLSSPAYQYGKFFELYTAAWNGGLPNTLAIQLPSWEAQEFEPRPRVTLKGLSDDEKEGFSWDYENGEPVEEALERASPEFKREWSAIFEGAESQWLEPQVVDRFFTEVPFRNSGKRKQAYYMHLDPATTEDAFAIAICHREGERVLFDHLYRFYVAPRKEYRPYEGEETVYYPEDTLDGVAHIDSDDVEEYLKDLLLSFNVHTVTYDLSTLHYFLGGLKRFTRSKGLPTRFRRLNPTREYNARVAESLRQGILEGRYRSCPSGPAREELIRLEKDRKGVVAKGKGSLDDLFDAAKNVADQAREGVETWDAAGGVSPNQPPPLRPGRARGSF